MERFKGAVNVIQCQICPSKINFNYCLFWVFGHIVVSNSIQS